MAIHYPPQYRYALYDSWDKEAFQLIKDISKTKNYPKILGNKEDKNQFLTMLIRTQKALGVPYEEYERRIKMAEDKLKRKENLNKDDWRNMLKNILEQIKETNVINTTMLNKKFPPESISKDTPAWVTYEGDKIVSDFIDELENRKIDFFGTDEEISEFVMRFILGQLGHDWEQTIMMIWEMLGSENEIHIKDLNREMQNFDYLKLFSSS